MGLSVEKVGLFCTPNIQKAHYLNKTVSVSDCTTDKEINLNNNPDNICFKGFLFNKAPKKPTLVPEPARLYGPYDLTQDDLDDNDSLTYELLEPIAECLTKNNPRDIEAFSYDTGRATEKAVNAMVPVCISMLACYPQTNTTFPEFHDSIARAFPKTCSKLDKEKGTGNMAKLYFKVRSKLEEFGKAANPKTESPIEDGIKYLYFADNLPLIREDRKEGVECTDDVIKLMREGQIPKMADISGAPRCSMSREKNEINEYGTPYIKEHFSIGKSKDKGQGVQYQNLWGRQRNRNYHIDRRPKIKEEEPEIRDYRERPVAPWDDMYSFPGGCYLDPNDPRYDGNI